MLADGAATAEDQQTLRRLVLLLVIEHLALVDQPLPSNDSSTCQLHMNKTSQCFQQTTQAVPNCDATGTANNTLRQGSSHAADNGPDRVPAPVSQQRECPTSPWLQETLARLSGRSAVGVSSSVMRRSSSRSQDHAAVCAWHELHHMPEAVFMESVQTAVMPRTLASRMFQQLVLVAKLGRDPVLSMEGLHVAAGRHEIVQLLLQQVQAVNLDEKCQVQETDNGGLVVSGYRNKNYVTSNIMSAEDLAWAHRLLPCTDFVAAVHKLMWWLQDCLDRQQLIQPVPSLYLIAAGNDAAAVVYHRLSVWGSAASVAVLSGQCPSAMRAAAATAAASMGAFVLQLQQQDVQDDLLIWHAVQDITQSAAAATQEDLAFSAAQGSSDSDPIGGHIENGAVGSATAVDKPTSQQQLSLVVLLDLHGEEKLEGNVLMLLQRWMSTNPGGLTQLQSTTCAAHSIALHMMQQNQQASQEQWCKLSKLQQQQLVKQQQHMQAAAISPSAADSAQDSGTAYIVNICFVLLCTPEQSQQLLSAMPAVQQQCYQLGLPANHLSEQLAADCKTELIARCEKYLLEHVKNAAALVHGAEQQYNEQAAAVAKTVAETCEAPSSQQWRPKAAIATKQPSNESVATRLADRLAAALVSIHSSASESYRLSQTESTPGSYSCDRSQMNQHTTRVAGCSAGHTWSLASQTVPLSKPYDVLQLLPHLLAETHKPLAAKRAALVSCLHALPSTQQLLQAEIDKQQRQVAKVEGQYQQPPGLTGTGMPCEVFASSLEALQRLHTYLQQQGRKWRIQLEQVGMALA